MERFTILTVLLMLIVASKCQLFDYKPGYHHVTDLRHNNYTRPPIPWNHPHPHPHPHPESECECGQIKPVNTVPIALEGKIKLLQEIPWRCHLNHSKVGLCGATIISSEWIMTAAHCFDKFQGDAAGDLDYGGGVTVTCGDHDRLSIDESIHFHVSINAKKIIIHEDYNKEVKYDNDIALIQLAQELTWKDNISPVCLPYRDEGFDCEHKGTKVISSGWGTTKNGGPPSRFLKVDNLLCLPREKCRDLYDKENLKISDNMICTYQPGVDTCKGDSGGSIDYQESDGSYYAIGIVSFGKGCGAQDYPGVYTRVTAYLDWIRFNTGKVVQVHL